MSPTRSCSSALSVGARAATFLANWQQQIGLNRGRLVGGNPAPNLVVAILGEIVEDLGLGIGAPRELAAQRCVLIRRQRLGFLIVHLTAVTAAEREQS